MQGLGAHVTRKINNIHMMLTHWSDTHNVNLLSPEFKFAKAQKGVALIIIDVQRDFCPPPHGNDPGWGALAIGGANEIVPVINKFKDNFPFGKVAITKDWHPPGHVSFASTHHGKGGTIRIQEKDKLVDQALWPDHCVQHTPGAELHPDLHVVTTPVWDGLRYTFFSDDIYTKGTNKSVDSYSAFYDNSGESTVVLDELLRFQEITEVVLVGLALDYCVKFTAMGAVDNGFNVTVCFDACRAVDPGNAATVTSMREKGINVISCDEYITQRIEKFTSETSLTLPPEFVQSLTQVF
jgi:nicotinamidase/pyrazinamidase